MIGRFGALSACLLLFSSHAFAEQPTGKGKPDKGGNEDPVAPFVPEILYRIDSQKSDELRFGNRAGDQAVLIYRGALGEAFDASTNSELTPQPNMIAFNAGGVVHLAEWSNNDGFTISNPQPLIGANSGLGGIAFSNADNKIAVDHGGRGLSVYSIPSGDIYAGSWTNYIGDDFNVIFPRWSPDDKSVYFFGGPYVDEQWVTGLYRYDFATGDLVKILDRTNSHGFYLDVAQGSNGQTLLVTSLDGVLKLYDATGGDVEAPTSPEGSIFRFNCDASAVIHSQYGKRGNALVISELSGGSSVYANRNVRPISSWMTLSPCP